MLENILSSYSLADSLRLIYNDSVKNNYNVYETIPITDETGYNIMLPVSKDSMYDMYIIIGRRIHDEFSKLLSDNRELADTFLNFKSLNNTFNNLTDNLYNYESTDNTVSNKILKVLKKLWVRDELVEDFRKYKISEIVKDILDNEEGLLDTYYINEFIYDINNDISLDTEKILIDSVNDYINKVTEITDRLYKRINDYGTAQEYLYKIRFKAMGRDNHISRLYHKKNINEGVNDFISNEFKKSFLKSSLCLLILILLNTYVYSIYSNGIVLSSLIILIIMTVLYLGSKIFKYSNLVSRLKLTIEKEYEVLNDLCDREDFFIRRYFINQ